MKIPGYEDLSPVARGGFASVFRARQTAFDREVAVKVLTVELGDGRDRRRFERECVLTGRLTGHPAIVTILDSGFTDHGQPYLTTPFYHAGSLAEQLRTRGPSSTADVLRIGVAVAGALEMAHRNGILHRDVKPGNVLLSAYGEPALTDFGIAAVVQANGATATQLTQAFTIDHAPPEVLEGGKATVCADVYSLGSTLWTLLAGRAPFASGDPGLIPRALKVRNDPLPPLGRPDVPPSLEAALAKAMAKRPEDRFDTAAAFGEALQHVQRELGEPQTPLRADAPLRTAAPRPADDDPAATQALSLTALEAFADDVPGRAAEPFAPDADGIVPVGRDDRAPAPVATRSATALPPPPAAHAGPVPRWRSPESGWTRPNDGVGAHPDADGDRARPTARGGAPVAAVPAAAHPHDRYGSGTSDGIAVLPAPAPFADPEHRAGPGSDPRRGPDRGAHPAPVGPASRPAPSEGTAPWAPLPGRRRRVGMTIALAGLVVAVLAAWLVLRPRGGDTTITTPNPGGLASTTAPPITTVPTTAGPATTPAPTTAKPAATTAAPTTTPTAPPTTKAPAPPTTAGAGTAVVPDKASPEVEAAADVAQRAGDALADSDWATVRALIPSLAGSNDATLDNGWGRLDGVTMVITDAKERRGQVALRVGEVAHERNGDDSRRTSLYCATWTVEDGHVVGMAAQQTIEPMPWRDGWADPAGAVELLRTRCARL